MSQLAIVQARMSSRRLPGKVLSRVHGKPLLAYLIERLARCRAVRAVVVATSVESDDDPVAALCGDLGVDVFRGPLDDVLARFIAAGTRFGADAVVRLNGDSPLLDPAIVDRGIREFEAAPADLVTNVMPRSFPTGQSMEVIAMDALRAADALTRDKSDREHVTPFLYRHPDRFRIRNFSCDRDLSDVRMVVDTPEDRHAFETLVGRMTRPHWDYGLNDLIALRDRG